MQIKIKELYINKTWRFLVPCLRGHGSKFVNKFNCLFKLAAGIHDDLKKIEENSIYIMFDALYKPKKYKEFIKYIKYKKYFIKEYATDSEKFFSRKRIIVIKIPQMFNNAYNKFLQGKYSEMYTDEELLFLFASLGRKKEYEILSKTGDSLNNFVKFINEEFNTITNPKDFYDSEWELPLKYKEEVFNYKGNTHFICNKN